MIDSWRAQSIMVEKACWQGGEAAGHSAPTIKSKEWTSELSYRVSGAAP